VKILIAEDEYTTRLMVQVCLEKYGYTVHSVADGNAAWDVLKKKNPPAIAILDWEMPGLTGVELCRRIKDLKRSTPIHVILLTARGGKNDILYGFDMGADDYIVKPFNDSELLARIRVAERVVTIQSSLNASLDELRRTVDLLDAFQDNVAVCRSCHKLETNGGDWERLETVAADEHDPRFVPMVCPDCRSAEMK
jgi:sigma-B regulation protein RsbU (phosphoserine phosphatase)